MDLTYEDVARILSLVDTAQGEDLTFALDGRRITVTSWKPQPVVVPRTSSRPTRSEPAAAPAPPPASLIDVRATELGHFRRLPGLGIGASVREGDTLGEIVGLPAAPARPVPAPAGGRIVDLWVDEGDFVEYGQVLLTLDAAAAAAPGETSPEDSHRGPQGRTPADRVTANQ